VRLEDSGVVTLLAGKPKVGKTTLVFGLATAVIHGDPFLGRTTRKSGVLLLTEENPSTLAEKETRWGIGAVHVLTYQQASGMAWPAVVEEAIAYCHDHGLGLLVIDTLAQWARLAGDSENDAGAALDQLRPLQGAAASGLAVLVISHQRKSSGDFGAAIRGSNAIAAAVDVIVELERPPNATGTRSIKSVSRFVTTPAEIVVEIGEDGYELRSAHAHGLKSARVPQPGLFFLLGLEADSG
jgi:RecA-family ATPase